MQDTRSKRINRYRKKHRRCRTCLHAKNVSGQWAWICEAKQKWHNIEYVQEAGIKGCFCRLYESRYM